MYTVYALLSETKPIIYVGLTNDLARRLKEHNSGASNWSKRYKPWKLIHTETFNTRSEARKREKQLKTGSGKEFLRQRAGIV